MIDGVIDGTRVYVSDAPIVCVMVAVLVRVGVSVRLLRLADRTLRLITPRQ